MGIVTTPHPHEGVTEPEGATTLMNKTELIDLIADYPDARLVTNDHYICEISRYDDDAEENTEDNFATFLEEDNPDFDPSNTLRVGEIDWDSVTDVDPLCVLTFTDGYLPITHVTQHPSGSAFILHYEGE